MIFGTVKQPQGGPLLGGLSERLADLVFSLRQDRCL